jgi:hypothetical protein
MSILIKLVCIPVVLLVGLGIANWVTDSISWGWVLGIPIALITVAFSWGLVRTPGPLSKEENANYNAYLAWCKAHGRHSLAR